MITMYGGGYANPRNRSIGLTLALVTGLVLGAVAGYLLTPTKLVEGPTVAVTDTRVMTQMVTSARTETITETVTRAKETTITRTKATTQFSTITEERPVFPTPEVNSTLFVEEEEWQECRNYSIKIKFELKWKKDEWIDAVNRLLEGDFVGFFDFNARVELASDAFPNGSIVIDRRGLFGKIYIDRSDVEGGPVLRDISINPSTSFNVSDDRTTIIVQGEEYFVTAISLKINYHPWKGLTLKEIEASVEYKLEGNVFMGKVFTIKFTYPIVKKLLIRPVDPSIDP